MHNRLSLHRDDELLAEFPLSGPIEISASSEAEHTLEGPDAPAVLVVPRRGSVWLFRLDDRALEPTVLPLHRRVALGGGYSLVRSARSPHEGRVPPGAPSRDGSRSTQRIENVTDCASSWTIFVGRGSEVRRLQVTDRPLRVGSAADNDLVLSDPTVSAQHCRFEPTGDALVLRDLGSTNGTHVQGLRVRRVEVATGVRVRVGRTDLCVMAAERRVEALRGPIVAASAGMQQVLSEALGFARLSWPALVLGPSGVGKEEISRAIHRESPRCKGPFVALNAGGLPRDLVESELFGHEKGAFTGAATQRRGAFEQAHGGTLLLDEIGELPLDMQTRLLRVLETWQIRRVGGENALDVDVRLICATHRDLMQMVAAGQFREDLYYRLARLVVRVPALSARPDDILPLAEHFLAGLESEMGPRALSRAARRRMRAYTWPGNVRELRNVLGTAAALTPASVLDAQDIELAIRRMACPLATDDRNDDAIARAVQVSRGNLAAASRALSIPRSTLRDRLLRARQRPRSVEP